MSATAQAAASTNVIQIADAKVDQLLAQLDPLWTTRHEGDLETRWQTGKLLNGLLDLPTKRQPYGAEVLAKVSEHLGLPKSEPSRMRWFAHHFTSLADLQAKYPEVTTWTAVRELLPSLAPKKGGKARVIAKKRSKSVRLPQLLGFLQQSATAFRQLTTVLDGKQKTELKRQVREIVKAASGSLKVRLKVVES